MCINSSSEVINGKLYHWIEDCDENNGGVWVMVYNNPDNPNDYDDNFCIHKDVCDCYNREAIIEYIKLYH